MAGDTYPAVCLCPCHGNNKGTSVVINHQGGACWCYQSQAPIVIVPPKFCPHCGKALT